MRGRFGEPVTNAARCYAWAFWQPVTNAARRDAWASAQGRCSSAGRWVVTIFCNVPTPVYRGATVTMLSKNAIRTSMCQRNLKSALRQQMRDTLAAMDSAAMATKSAAVCSALAATDQFADADVIMAYLFMPGELDIDEMVRGAFDAGKTVLVPRVESQVGRMTAIQCTSLQTGLSVSSYGIREPVGGEEFPARQIDLIIVPGLAFDRAGNRLGRGGGYYDRFLTQPGLTAVRCAVAFHEQLVECVPASPHDQPVDLLVTDKQVLQFEPTGAPPPSGKHEIQE